MVREGQGIASWRGSTWRIRLKNETTCERFRMDESSERRRGSSWERDKKAGSEEKSRCNGGGGALRSLLRGFGVEVKDIDVTRRVAGTKGGRHAKRHSIFAVSAGGKYQAIQNARNSPPHIYINAAILAAGHQNQNRIEMNAAEPPPRGRVSLLRSLFRAGRRFFYYKPRCLTKADHGSSLVNQGGSS